MITKHMDDNSRSCGFIQPVTQEKYAKQLRKDRLSICTIRKISLGGTTKQSRFIALILILSIMLTLIPPIPRSNAATGADLTVGKYIYFGYYDIDKNDSKDEDERILWRVIHRDGNNVLLLTDKIIMLKAFDGKDASQVDADRKNNGSNNWADSNLRLWLNSTSQSMDDNSYGGSNEAPNNANVWTNYNEYSTEDGFLSDTNFTVDERSVIVPVNNKYVIDTGADTAEGNGGTEHTYSDAQPDEALLNYDISAYQTVQGQLAENDKVFVLSIKELADYVDGNTTLDINGNYHIATTTSDARTYSEYDMSSNTGNWYYWTRDAYTSNSYDVRHVSTVGTVYNYCRAFTGSGGVRPALWLDTSSMTLADVSGATEAAAYTVTSYPDPTPPNAPTINITSPAGFTGNTNQDVTFTITDNGDNAGGSGVDKNQYSYDNATWTDYTAPVTLNTEGARTIYARTLDVAGNISANTTRTVNIDRTPPVAPTVNIGTGTYGAAQNVIVTAAGDAASTYYTLDGTEPDNTDTLVASGGTITVDGNNGQTVTLKVVSYDAAGNKGSILTRQYTFEKTNATITVTFTERTASTDDITATITIDNEDSWGYKWTNNTEKPTDGWLTAEPVTRTTDGVWYLHIHALKDEQETYVVKGPFIKGNIPVTEGYEIGTAPTDRRNFKYYIGKDKNGITKVMLVSITTKDTNFDRDDILDEQNKYRDGIYYIDRDGKIKQYSAN